MGGSTEHRPVAFKWEPGLLCGYSLLLLVLSLGAEGFRLLLVTL